jgi:hypothetical protein
MRRPNVSISHQFYMDDLKLYARSPDQLQSMFAPVQSFSDYICMEFGLEKCAVFHSKKGNKVHDAENGLRIMGDIVIQDLGVVLGCFAIKTAQKLNFLMVNLEGHL